MIIMIIITMGLLPAVCADPAVPPVPDVHA